MPGTSLTRTSLTRTSRAAAAMLVAAAAVLAAPAATAAPRGPLEPTAVPVSTVAAYPDGTFLESVAVGADGAAYVTVALDARIDRVTPAGEVSTFAQFPALGDGSLGFPPTGPSSIVGTVVIAPDSTLYATYVNTAEPELSGVYSVTAQGRRLVTRLPEGSQPNGITVDRDGTIYVADSALGLVWRARPGEAVVRAWVTDPLLAPTGNGFPGANGVKIFRGALYVSNSGTAEVVRIPVRRDGSPGAPVTYATGVPIDDFAFDVTGDIYGTTHPFDTVVRVGRDGTQEVVAGIPEGVVGPTAAAFGTVRGDRTSLYVVTDGGLFGRLIDPDAPTAPPGVFRLDVGIPGLPMPGTSPAHRG